MRTSLKDRKTVPSASERGDSCGGLVKRGPGPEKRLGDAYSSWEEADGATDSSPDPEWIDDMW